MDELLRDYLPIIVFLVVSLGIGLALLVSPFLLAFKAPDPEKLSAYECGFNAFDDARMKFDVRFYLVSILFIIFDLEVAFLFPWAVAFKEVGLFGFWSMIVFLGVLTVGFAYEWKKGALEIGTDREFDAGSRPAKGIIDPNTGKPVGANDPFFTEVNAELADKGFLVTATDDLINWAARAP